MGMNAVGRVAAPQEECAKEQGSDQLDTYLMTLNFVERLHRQLLDVVKHELDQAGQTDINSVQAMLLFNIGDAELTAGELRTRGHYLGSNVSYNLKKLVEAGYIHHERSDQDRRSVRVRLTDMGLETRDRLNTVFMRHTETLKPVGDVGEADLSNINDVLRRLERFWSDQIRYRL